METAPRRRRASAAGQLQNERSATRAAGPLHAGNPQPPACWSDRFGPLLLVRSRRTTFTAARLAQVYCQPASPQSTFSLISRPSPPINAAMTKPTEAPSLADLRKEIDRIDEAMHQLLIERGDIIDRLISVKRSQDTGTSAFRPAREAEMMRRLVKRHKGILPLDTVESIWRVIISTFTYVQAPFSVHADLSAGDALMRTARASISASRCRSCRIWAHPASSPLC